MIGTTSPSKKTLHAAEQDRPDVAAARAALMAEQSRLDPRRLVFIDETAVTTKMVRQYGRAPAGERLVAKVPHGHWKTLTLIAAIRVDGVTAPYVIDGAMDGVAFIAYITSVLAPTLKKGDVVFMDNVRTRQGRRSGRSIARGGGETPLLAGLLARFEPDRKRLLQNQMWFAQSRRAHRQRSHKSRWALHQNNCTLRLRRLLQECWLSRVIQIKWIPL